MPWICVLVIATIFFMAIFAPLLAPYSPIDQTLRDKLLPPFWMDGGSTKYILGTDAFGRDILSRLIYGARVSLIVAALALTAGGGVGPRHRHRRRLHGWRRRQHPHAPRRCRLHLSGNPVRTAARRHHGAGPRHTGHRHQPAALGELRTRHPRRGPGLEAARLRRSRQGARLLGAAHHAHAHPAERAQHLHGAGHAQHRRRDHRRGGAELPRRRHSAADPHLGSDGLRRTRSHRRGVVGRR